MAKLSFILFGALAVGLQASPTSAQVSFDAGGGVTFDDNVLRQSRAASDTAGTPRSDQIYSLSGTMLAQARPADIDSQLQLRVGQDLYESYRQFNNFNYDAKLAATRSSDEGIGLDINAESQRRLSSFAELRAPIRNLQFLNQIDVEATLPITPEIRGVIDPTFTQTQNSNDVVKYSDYRQYGLRGGIGWFTPLGNSIELTVTRRNTEGLGSRPVTVDGSTVNAKTDLADTSADLKLVYAVSQLTSVSAFVSYVNRDDHSVLHANYRGPAGSLTVDYHPRGTLKLTLTGGRRLEGQSLLLVDAVRTDYVTFTGMARLANRVDLKIIGNYYHQRLRYDPLYSSGLSVIDNNNGRVDAQASYLIGRRVRATLGYTHEWGSSNYVLNNFAANTIQLGVIVGFGNKREND